MSRQSKSKNYQAGVSSALTTSWAKFENYRLIFIQYEVSIKESFVLNLSTMIIKF